MKIAEHQSPKVEQQKELETLLGNLTESNYAIVMKRILAMGIDSATTLKGLIDQMFEKALSVPELSMPIAHLCHDLSEALPSTEVVGEQGKLGNVVEFCRILLNKCQSEFEEGAARRAAEARERHEQEKEAAKTQADKEEGDHSKVFEKLSDTEWERQQTAKLAAMLAASHEYKVRQRSVGTIQFIGDLYLYGLLAGEFVHGCITTLLTETPSPKAEEVECLHKLMSTVSHMLDSIYSRRGTELLDAYLLHALKMKVAENLEPQRCSMVQDIIKLWEDSPAKLALRSKNLVRDYLIYKDPKLLFLHLQDLSTAGKGMAKVVEGFFYGIFALNSVFDPDGLVEMLVDIARNQDQAQLTAEHLEAGLKLVINSLDKTYADGPFAPKLVGKAIGALVAQGVLDLKRMTEYLLKAESEEEPEHGEDEDTALVDSGKALKAVTALLERLLAVKGASAIKEAWAATGLSLLQFAPKSERNDLGKLQEIINENGLQSVCPMEGILNFLPAALAEGKSAAYIGEWIQEHARDAADAPEFAEFLAMQLFPLMLGSSPDPSRPLFNADSGFVPLLLTYVAKDSKREVAMVLGAQNVYKDLQSPKGLLRRMLTDLHQLRIVSRPALEAWWNSTNDIEAVRDVSSCLDELKQSDVNARQDNSPVASPLSIDISAGRVAPPAEKSKELSPDEIAMQCKKVVAEYLTNGDPKELFLGLQELSSADTAMVTVVEEILGATFESEGTDLDSLMGIISMMAFVITRKWDQAHMTAYDLEAGLKSVISRPDETINDPFASKTSGAERCAWSRSESNAEAEHGAPAKAPAIQPPEHARSDGASETGSESRSHNSSTWSIVDDS